MNDLEINKAVARKLGHEYIVNGGELYILVEYPEPICEQRQRFRDYCNDPSDAWPIIEKYKISLQYEYMMGSWSADCVTHSILDESALKAAMLCFLEMEIKDDK